MGRRCLNLVWHRRGRDFRLTDVVGNVVKKLPASAWPTRLRSPVTSNTNSLLLALPPLPGT